jgi:hypothetical protein
MSAIIAVSPDAYERMMAKLNAGEEFVKTYRSYCPHAKKPQKCNCPFYKNILVNGEIMREVDGELIKIHNYADLIKTQQRAVVILPSLPKTN